MVVYWCIVQSADARALWRAVVTALSAMRESPCWLGNSSELLAVADWMSNLTFASRVWVYLCSVLNKAQTRARALARCGFSIVRSNASVAMLNFLWWTIQTPTRARARAWSCVLSTMDKSVRPSASLKNHRILNSAFEITCRLFFCGQYRPPCARAHGVVYCPH